MIRISALLLALTALIACGADGEPTPPTVSGKTSVSMNSQGGLSSKASIAIQLGSG
jgi:hypothetical protein